MAARPPVSAAQRQRYRAIYKLMLDYYDEKQRARQAQDASPTHASPLTGSPAAAGPVEVKTAIRQ